MLNNSTSNLTSLNNDNKAETKKDKNKPINEENIYEKYSIMNNTQLSDKAKQYLSSIRPTPELKALNNNGDYLIIFRFSTEFFFFY